MGGIPVSTRQDRALALAGRVGNAVEHDGGAWHLCVHGAMRCDSVRDGGAILPTLIRLIVVLLVLAGLGYGALWGLANWVQPKEREISFTVPPERIGK